MSRIENPREAIKDDSTGIFCLSIMCQYGLLTIFTAGRAVKECFCKLLGLFLKTGVIISFCSVIHKNLLTDDSLSIEDPG